MNFQHLRCLRGANAWAARPVVEVALDLTEETSWSPEQLRQTLNRLEGSLPGSTEAAGDLEPSLLRLALGFTLAVRKLQELAGTPVSGTWARATSRPGLFLTAVEFVEDVVGQAAAETALRLLQAATAGQAFSLEEDLRPLRALEYKRRFPTSTATVYHAARARGIPAGRLNPEYGRYVLLGQGSKQHRCLASEPDTASAVARFASTDKHLAKQLLQAAGVPVPQGRLVSTAEEAWAAASELGLPVAVKPVDSDLATGVSLDLQSREQVEAAFREASQHSDEVLVERFAPGLEHRVLVVGGRVSAVARIEPPHVVGDGVCSVAQLVEKVNQDPRRGEAGSGRPLYLIKTDEMAREVLAGQGLTLDSVPPSGRRVLLRRNPPYIKNGGSLADLTEVIHPGTAAHAVAAAQAVQLPVAGLDVVALDITRPLEEQEGVIVEINTSPGLWLHLAPWADSPRPVGRDIVDALFPLGEDGRIPVAAVVGDASGAAARHLTALLGLAGLCAGSVDPTEVAVGGRRWVHQAATPQERAGLLFLNPTVDVALLRTTPRELLRAGLGNDRCEVALLLDGRPVESPEEDPGHEPGSFVRALRNALGRRGTLVVAEEALGIDPALPTAQLLLVSGRGDHPRLREHLAAGGRALTTQGERLVLAHGNEAPVLLGKRPGDLGERDTLPLLAALGAGLGLGQGTELLKRYVDSLR
jgi:cyanophycin synthetase